MILQVLYRHYYALEAKGEISPPGMGEVGVSYALNISGAGELKRVICIKEEQPRGKKTVIVPQGMRVPAPVKRTVGVASNFICDHSGYLLGIDNKGKPERTAECFAACKELHKRILSGVESKAAKAVLAFFENWQPEYAAEHPALQEYWEELISGVNLVFYHDGKFVHQDEAVLAAWQKHFMDTGDGETMPCLITGECSPAEAVHPAIKGIAGAQSSGAALVSFNAPAFCSYNKEQSLNAPVSKMAAFAYTTALNHLIADRKHTMRIGDTTVLFWAERAEPTYQKMFALMCGMEDIDYSEKDLWDKADKLLAGNPVDFDEARLSPETQFYILGISPNAARLSVRFFIQNSFGGLLRNVMEHHSRMDIVRPKYDSRDHISLWGMVQATVNMNSRDKAPVPNMAGEVLRAILSNTNYPATLLNGVMLRIRAEREITRERAAIIKAYYSKNKNESVPEEVLQVSLNKESNNTAYCLGRLFSVLENIQTAANPGIKATIRDKYFTSAASTPSVVFPTLINLSLKHLKKLRGDKYGLCVNFEKSMGEIMGKLEETYPNHLSLPEQGAFQLGYYHQTQARYENKEED